MKKMKKTLSLILTMIMLISIVPNFLTGITVEAAVQEDIYDVLGISTNPNDLAGYSPDKSIDETPLGAEIVGTGSNGLEYILQLDAKDESTEGEGGLYGEAGDEFVSITNFESWQVLPNPFPTHNDIRVGKSKAGNFSGQGEKSGIATLYVNNQNLYLEFYDPMNEEVDSTYGTIALTNDKSMAIWVDGTNIITDKVLNKLYQLEVGDYNGDGYDDVAVLYAIPEDENNVKAVKLEIYSNPTGRWLRGADNIGWQKIYSLENPEKFTQEIYTREYNKSDVESGTALSNMLSLATRRRNGRDDLFFAYSYFSPSDDVNQVLFSTTKVEKLSFDKNGNGAVTFVTEAGITRGGLAIDKVKNDMSVTEDTEYLIVGGTLVGEKQGSNDSFTGSSQYFYSKDGKNFWYRTALEFYDTEDFAYQGGKKSDTEGFSDYTTSHQGLLSAPAVVMAGDGPMFDYGNVEFAEIDSASEIVDFAIINYKGNAKVMNRSTVINVDYSTYVLHSFEGQPKRITQSGNSEYESIFAKRNPIHYMGTWKSPVASEVLSRGLVSSQQGSFFSGLEHAAAKVPSNERMYITVNNDVYHLPFLVTRLSADGLLAKWVYTQFHEAITTVDMVHNAPEYMFGIKHGSFTDYSKGSGFTFVYDHYEVEYSDPDILAVLASPPYFEELDIIDSSNRRNSNTTYTSKTGSGTSESEENSMSIGAYINISSESSVFGLTMARAEIETSFDKLKTKEFSSEETYTYSMTYGTTGGQDTVALYCLPMDVYYYKVYGTSDGVTMNGELMAYRVPRYRPITTTMSVEDYDNLIAESYGMQKLRDSVILHKAGYPETYTQYNEYDAVFKMNDSVAVGYGTGFTGQGVEVNSTETHTVKNQITSSLKEGVGGMTIAGINISSSEGSGYSNINFSGDEYTVTLYDLPTDADDASRNTRNLGYAFQYKMLVVEESVTSYCGKINKFPYITYSLKNVEAPPKLPKDFGVKSTEADSITLSWTPVDTNENVRYDIYRLIADSYVLVGNDIEGSEWTDTDNIREGVAYKYKIEAVDPTAVKSGRSIRSDEITAVAKKPVTPLVISNKIVSMSTGSEAVSSFYAQKGENVSLITTVSGQMGNDTVYYQWQKQNILGSWTDVVGETESHLDIAWIRSSDMGAYRCRITRINEDSEQVYYSSVMKISDNSAEILGMVITIVPQYGDAVYQGEYVDLIVSLSNPLDEYPEDKEIGIFLSNYQGNKQIDTVKISQLQSGAFVKRLENLVAADYIVKLTAPDGYEEEILTASFKVVEDPGVVTEAPEIFEVSIEEYIESVQQSAVQNSIWLSSYNYNEAGNIVLPNGSSAVFAVIPPVGYEVQSVTADNADVVETIDGRYMLSKISADTKVSVRFVPETYNVLLRTVVVPSDITIGEVVVDPGTGGVVIDGSVDVQSATAMELSGAVTADATDAGGTVIIPGDGTAVLQWSWLPYYISASYGNYSAKTSYWLSSDYEIPSTFNKVYEKASLPVEIGGTEDIVFKLSGFGNIYIESEKKLQNMSCIVESWELDAGGEKIDMLNYMDGNGEFVYNEPNGHTKPLVSTLSYVSENYEVVTEYDADNQAVTFKMTNTGEFVVVFADYEDGVLVNVNTVEKATPVKAIFTVKQTDLNFTLSSGDKVFIWNNLTLMEPLAETLVIQ